MAASQMTLSEFQGVCFTYQKSRNDWAAFIKIFPNTEHTEHISEEIDSRWHQNMFDRRNVTIAIQMAHSAALNRIIKEASPPSAVISGCCNVARYV
jgi:hypothetical protein